jgi:hypothetical protein
LVLVRRDRGTDAAPSRVVQDGEAVAAFWRSLLRTDRGVLNLGNPTPGEPTAGSLPEQVKFKEQLNGQHA